MAARRLVGRARPAVLTLAGGALAGALAGCGMALPTLHTASPPADRIARLGWFVIWLSAVVFAGVIVALVAAARHHRARDAAVVDLAPKGHGWVVWGGAVIPSLILVAVFLAGTTALGRFPAGRAAPDLEIRVTGHQWWWEVAYLGRGGGEPTVTANEIHIPVGEPVRVLLTSRDVIHSFWVPELQGKLDLNPGATNELLLEADHPGRYTGRCAEYCGLQHATMAFVVIAEAPADFRAWLAAQRAPAHQPADSLALAGRQLVATGPCAACHTVRGTAARGRVGPDLTHLASRRTIAAGTLPNTRGYLEAWVNDAQAFKPGALMPPLPQFTGRELRAIAVYLGELR